MSPKLEIIGFTIEDCIRAQEAGASRIELCDNASEGGTTPSYGFIKEARKQLQIELYVMIRPRGGNFVYSNEEFEMMHTDISICKQLGCDGVVLGILTEENNVDIERCRQLIEEAYPMEVTFHRAFDRVQNPMEALETIVDLGCERILTSGQKPTAPEGVQLIAELVRHANDRIIIMPGSGVRSENIASLLKATGATEFHSSARTARIENGIDEEEIKRIVKTLKKSAA